MNQEESNWVEFLAADKAFKDLLWPTVEKTFHNSGFLAQQDLGLCVQGVFTAV